MKLKRLLALVLCMIMTAITIPQAAYAAVGALTVPDSGSIRHGCIQSSVNKQYYEYIQNDYITFVVLPDSGYTATLPTALYEDYMTKDNISYLPWTEEYYYWTVMPNTDSSIYNRKLYSTYGYTSYIYTGDTITGLSAVSNLKYKTDDGSKAECGTVTNSYEIVQLDEGTTEGETVTDENGVVTKVSDDSGRTWGVRMTTEINYTGPMPSSLYADSSLDLRMSTLHVNFAGFYDQLSNGTKNVEGAIEFSCSNGYDRGDRKAYYESHVIDPTTNLPMTNAYYNSAEITEIYTRSFSNSNAFVAMNGYWDYFTNGVQYGGVEGHADIDNMRIYDEKYAYDAKAYFAFYEKSKTTTKLRCLKTYNDITMSKTSGTKYTLYGLWGFRDLYTSSESGGTVEIPDTDYTKVESGTYIGIKSDGSDTVLETADTYSELLGIDGVFAILRGEYTLSSTDENTYKYTFKGGKLSLSPTVTATWDEASGGSFVIYRDKTSGSCSLAMKGVSLSTPSFTFYSPASDSASFTFGKGDNGLLIGGLNENNAAKINIDIPGAKTLVSSAELGIDGKIVLDGTMNIDTPVLDIADINVDTVEINSKGNISGIIANGSVTMPEILGMPSGNVSADINTFSPNERYSFALELSIPHLFETDASLTLTRLKNGQLVPDSMSLFANGEVTGIPLVSPVVVAELTGAGGGFSNLSKTIDGSFNILPPIRLTVKGKARVLRLLEGTATMTTGIGYYDLTLSDASIRNIDLGATYNEKAYFTAEQRTYYRSKYKTTTFTGLAVGGGKSLKVNLPNDSLNIIRLDSGVEIDLFAGTNAKELYLCFNGSGWVSAGLYFPKKIGSLSLGNLANKQISGAGLELTLGGNVIINNGNKNLLQKIEEFSAKATLAYSAKFIGSNLKIKAIFNDKKVELGWGKLNTTISWSGSKAKSAALLDAGMTDDGNYYAIVAESNAYSLGSTSDVSAAGINTNDTGLKEAGVTITQNSDNSYTIDTTAAKDTEELSFRLTQSTDMDDSSMMNYFTVTKDGAEYALSFMDTDPMFQGDTIDANALDDLSKYNAYISSDEDEGSYGITFEANGAGIYTVSAPTSFDIEGFAAEPSEEFAADGTFTALSSEKLYELRSYLVGSDGKYYQLESTDLASDETRSATDILTADTDGSYDFAPTGSYTIAYRLIEKTEELDENGDPVLDEDGNKTYYYTALDEYIGSLAISNSNPNDIAAPTNVTAEAVGSEQIKASWTAPLGYTPDGYIVSVYQKDENGDLIDTGAAYETDGTVTELLMAPTIGDAETALKANSDYYIAVTAYQNLTGDFDEDGVEDTYAKRSEAAYSSSVYLPEAVYPTIAYYPSAKTLDDGSNMKMMYVEPGDTISVYEASYNVIKSLTVTRLDTNEELTLSSQGDFGGGITVPDFIGSIMLEFSMTDSDGDTTTDYISLRRDDMAPILTLDNDDIRSNSNGDYTLSGVTGPGLTVQYSQDADMSDCKEVTVADDGTFVIEDTLTDDAKDDGYSEVYLMTWDAAYNYAYAGAVVVWGGGELSPGYEITYDPSGGSVSTTSAVTDSDGKLTELPTATRGGYEFLGWYTAAQDGEKVTTDTVFTEDTTVYAQWQSNTTPEPTEAPKNSWSIDSYDSGNGTVTFTAPSDLGDVTRIYIFAAVYRDSDTGILTDITNAETTEIIPGAQNTVTLPKTLSGSVKLMLWDENLSPLCEAFTQQSD